MKLWTKEEVDYVRENYHSKTAQAIADYLGRKEGSIRYKIKDIGLEKTERPQDYTEKTVPPAEEFVGQNPVTKPRKKLFGIF